MAPNGRFSFPTRTEVVIGMTKTKLIKFTFFLFLIKTSMIAFLGCGGSSHSTTPPPIAAPLSLTYTPNPAIFTFQVKITELTPAHSGGNVESYSVAPQLPAGLSLNTSTGVISGTPTLITPNGNYAVTATNSAGSTITSLSITVNDAAPFNLTYPLNPLILTHGIGGIGYGPVNGGGTITSYTVAPTLPAGLTLDPIHGVIWGTPVAITLPASYTFTGTNSGGSTSETIVIEVK